MSEGNKGERSRKETMRGGKEKRLLCRRRNGKKRAREMCTEREMEYTKRFLKK